MIEIEEEARLVVGLRGGDARSFDRVYALLSGAIFSFLLRASGRRDTAEDLAQETWLKLARAAPTLRDDTRLGPLLFTIARNVHVSHRRWALLDLSRIVTLGFQAIATVADPEVMLERGEAIAQLEAALAALPFASREVLLLVGVHGLEHYAVAAILGLTSEALRQRLHRARGALAAKIQRLERPGGDIA